MTREDETQPREPAHDYAELCVLASSSSGNCSVVRVTRHGVARLTLIDCGLSPRRTKRILETLGHTLDDLDAVVTTHLDDDHACPSWGGRSLPESVAVHVHKRHARAAERRGFFSRRGGVFDARCDLPNGITLSSVLGNHDEHGTAVLRLSFDGLDGDLGYATDIGRATTAITTHLSGVRVLAMESNYCPNLEQSSPRPEIVKRRVMGGFGHLSNLECAEAAASIAPEHLILLHLSRQCNVPELAASYHDGRAYRVTIATPSVPTPWIEIARASTHTGHQRVDRGVPSSRPFAVGHQPGLF
ncbi:MAG: MBL fold metallo-hydrolase [Phycisphaerales bacterium]